MKSIEAEREHHVAAEGRRERAFGTALTELLLMLSLILSIAAIVAVAGSSGALAAARTDLIMIEEVGSSFTTAGIVTVIAVVMGVLTVLALRDVAPAHSKRDNRRSNRN